MMEIHFKALLIPAEGLGVEYPDNAFLNQDNRNPKLKQPNVPMLFELKQIRN